MLTVMEKEITSTDQMKKLYDNSAFTIEGVARNKENVKFIAEWLEKNEALAGKDIVIWWCSGAFMNEYSNLSGDNAYPNNSSIMIIDPDSISLMRVVSTRFEVQGRWLDDVIDNNERRESC